jgi:hypothetical protein
MNKSQTSRPGTTVPFKCECGHQVPVEILQKHLNECPQMLHRYSGFVRAYVTLKQSATSSGPNQMQMLQNIVTLTNSFINDVHLILPRQSPVLVQAPQLQMHHSQPV